MRKNVGRIPECVVLEERPVLYQELLAAEDLEAGLVVAHPQPPEYLPRVGGGRQQPQHGGVASALSQYFHAVCSTDYPSWNF
jgi:hypothetical protein